MALAGRIETREHTPPYFNEDGSYTRFGVEMEISKHIIRVPNHGGSLKLMAEAKELKIVSRFKEMAPGIAYLCNPDIEAYEDPARHGNNSEAEYVIDWLRYKADGGKENIIWFSRIPPRKGTSKPPHTHGINPVNNKGIYEHYLKEAGIAYIGEGENRRLMNEYEVVAPNTEHYIEASEDGAAIFFILIENVEGIENKDIHQYLQAA